MAKLLEGVNSLQTEQDFSAETQNALSIFKKISAYSLALFVASDKDPVKPDERCYANTAVQA